MVSVGPKHSTYQSDPLGSRDSSVCICSAHVLFLMTITLLFGPKVLSVIHLFSRPREVAAFGGPIRVLSGVILETLFSILTAPILIWFHTRFVLRELDGKSV